MKLELQHLVKDIDSHFNRRTDIEYVEVSRQEWEAIKAAIAKPEKKAAPHKIKSFGFSG